MNRRQPWRAAKKHELKSDRKDKSQQLEKLQKHRGIETELNIDRLDSNLHGYWTYSLANLPEAKKRTSKLCLELFPQSQERKNSECNKH